MASPARAGLIHDFEFQGSLADSLGGPSLTSLGGTVGVTGYVFGAEQGLSLSGALTTAQASTYTIDLSFKFDSLTGYKKIIDFKNLTSDNGLYNFNSSLNYYPFTSTGANSDFVAGSFVRVDLTRDNSSGLVVGYFNGVQQFSFTDSTSDAVFNATNSLINFFQDDNVTGGRESTSGTVNQIRIYDTSLTSSEIVGLGTVVPEPSSVFLTAVGLAFAGLGTRRVRQGR